MFQVLYSPGAGKALKKIAENTGGLMLEEGVGAGPSQAANLFHCA